MQRLRLGRKNSERASARGALAAPRFKTSRGARSWRSARSTAASCNPEGNGTRHPGRGRLCSLGALVAYRAARPCLNSADQSGARLNPLPRPVAVTILQPCCPPLGTQRGEECGDLEFEITGQTNNGRAESLRKVLGRATGGVSVLSRQEGKADDVSNERGVSDWGLLEVDRLESCGAEQARGDCDQGARSSRHELGLWHCGSR